MTVTATKEKLDLNNIAIVLRGSGMEVAGLQRERGEVLSTVGWRNYQALVNQRYLGAATYDLNETYVDCSCGRKWINSAAAANHICPTVK
jgi:hypothetical protein